MLNYYTKRYEVIVQGNYPENRKKIMLINLMNEMEETFDMPIQSDPEWARQNVDIHALYQQVSASKNL